MRTQTKIITTNGGNEIEHKSYTDNGNQVWRRQIRTGGIQNDNKTYTSDGTQTSLNKRIKLLI